MIQRGTAATDSPRGVDVWRAALAIALFAAAALWPLLNVGDDDAPLIILFGSHGVDRRDVFAVVPFVGAIVVVLTPWRRRMSILGCLVVAAIGIGLGIALGFVAKALR